MKYNRLFWLAVLLHAAVWIVLPCILHTGYRNDDVIETQIIAKEWVMATCKHPMLPAWMLEIVNTLTCRSFAAPFICSQICVIIACWSVWQLGRTVLSEKKALFAAFTALSAYFFTYQSLIYNQNIPFIAFWALTMCFFWKAYLTGRLFYWTSSGLSLGLCFHSKYPAVFLVIALLAFMFTRSAGRKYWKTPGPYLTTLTALLVFSPHIVWLIRHQFITFDYAANNHIGTHFLSHFTEPLTFVLHQSQFWILPLLMLFPLLGAVWRWQKQTEKNVPQTQCIQYLLFCALIPFAVFLIYAALTKKHMTGAYGSCLWNFFGVWALLCFRTKDKPFEFRNVILCLLAVETATAALMMVHLFNNCYHGKLFPARELGAVCETVWQRHCGGHLCPYLSGDYHICGYASQAMPERPSVLLYNVNGNIDNLGNRFPIIDSATDADLNKKGGMILWNLDKYKAGTVPHFLHSRYPSARVLDEHIELPYHTWTPVPPLKIGIAVVPPKDHSIKQ